MKIVKFLILCILFSLVLTSCEVTFFPKGAESALSIEKKKEETTDTDTDTEEDDDGDINVNVHLNNELPVIITGNNLSSVFIAAANEGGLTSLTYWWTVNGETPDVPCSASTFVWKPTENKIYIISCAMTAFKNGNYLAGSNSLQLDYRNVDLSTIR